MKADTPSLRESVEWRPLLWERASAAAFEIAKDVLVPGRRVLEVGFQSGMMSCYLARRYGVRVVGYEVDPRALSTAVANRKRFGLTAAEVDFRLSRPDARTPVVADTFDAIFMKSVLYQVATPPEYVEWLRWARAHLRPNGCLIAIENGVGALPVQFYRRWIARRRYARFCLTDRDRLADFRAEFPSVAAAFFGRYSPLFEAIPLLARGVLGLETAICPPSEQAHFVAAIVARRDHPLANP